MHFSKGDKIILIAPFSDEDTEASPWNKEANYCYYKNLPSTVVNAFVTTGPDGDIYTNMDVTLHPDAGVHSFTWKFKQKYFRLYDANDDTSFIRSLYKGGS